MILFLIQSLVQHGASVFIEDDQNLTACDIAEQSGHTAVAAYLETKMVFNVHVSRILMHVTLFCLLHMR